MYEIVFTDSYVKRAKNFFKKHPDLISRYEKVLRLMEYNPFHPSLRLHKLEGKLSHFYSISINMNYRIIIELIIDNEKIILVNIGAHDEIY